MILLWGTANDPPLAAVRKILSRDGVNYFFLDQRAVLNTELELTVDDTGANGFLRVEGKSLSLDTISAVYPRPYPLAHVLRVETASFSDSELQRAIVFNQLFSIWLDLTSASVFNRPCKMNLNASKPYQGLLIEKAGFAAPETLLTTDPDAARAFCDRHTAAIYKSISARRSIVSKLSSDDRLRLGNVIWCPTQFQERISGSELRVHVVGDDVFASKITTRADDYRYAPLSGDTVDISACELDQTLADRCRAVSTAMGFHIAGIDMRLQGDTWYCFEVNPSPGFSYYQERTGQPIDEALCRLLRAGCNGKHNKQLFPEVCCALAEQR